MKFVSWGDVYFSGLSRGYDPGYAAWKADQWEKRKKREVVMKLVRYQEESCGSFVICELSSLKDFIEDFIENSTAGEKAHLEIIEMTEEEFRALPEFDGC